MCESEIYLDREIEYLNDPAYPSQTTKLKVPECKATLRGDYRFFRTRGDGGEITIHKDKVLIIRSGTEINR